MKPRSVSNIRIDQNLKKDHFQLTRIRIILSLPATLELNSYVREDENIMIDKTGGWEFLKYEYRETKSYQCSTPIIRSHTTIQIGFIEET